MDVDYRYASAQKGVKTPSLCVHIVLDTGAIKGVLVSTNQASPWLDIEFIRHPITRRPIGIRSVRLSTDAERRGFKLLRELYDDEGWPGGYDQYVAYEEGNRGRAGVETFPDSALPKAVLELRARSNAPKIRASDLVSRPDTAPKAAKK